MENQYGRRLGKTSILIQKAEAHMANAPIGTLVHFGDVVLVRTLEGITATDNGKFEAKGGGVADALAKLSKVIDATLTITQKGRAYRIGEDRLTVQIWSKDYTMLDTVKEVFGGNYYRHGSGFIWACSKRSQLMNVWEGVKDHVEGNNLASLEEMYGLLRQSEHETEVQTS